MASTKYSAGGPEWRWRRHDGHPRLTTHCLDRWDERMPDDARSPEFAYLNSTVAPGIEYHPYFDKPDRVRPDAIYVYRGRTVGGETYSAVFIEGGRFDERGLVTVYSIETIRDSAVRAYLHAVVDQEPSAVIDEAEHGGAL